MTSVLCEKWKYKMADSDEWFVGEDGCLSIGKPVDSVTYHSTLNTILVATKEPAVQVLDVTSGSLLQNSDLSGGHIFSCFLQNAHIVSSFTVNNFGLDHLCQK